MDITVNDNLLHCRDMFCLKHKEKISELYSTIVASYINNNNNKAFISDNSPYGYKKNI